MENNGIQWKDRQIQCRCGFKWKTMVFSGKTDKYNVAADLNGKQWYSVERQIDRLAVGVQGIDNNAQWKDKQLYPFTIRVKG